MNLNRQFKDSLNYVKDSMGYIYFAFFMFLLFVFLGFYLNKNLGFIDIFLKELINRVSGLNLIELILFILQNNIQASFYGLIFGVFFAIFPLLDIAVNGIFVGYVLAKVEEIGGIYQIWRLFPHGIFELPAVFISLGLGLKLGMFVFSKKPMGELKKRVLGSLNSFLFIVVPLLVIAASIEGALIFFSG